MSRHIFVSISLLSPEIKKNMHDKSGSAFRVKRRVDEVAARQPCGGYYVHGLFTTEEGKYSLPI